MPKHVNLGMRSCQKAVSGKKSRVTRDRLVQQVNRPEQIFGSSNTICSSEEKIPGARIKIKGGEIRGDWPFERAFLLR